MPRKKTIYYIKRFVKLKGKIIWEVVEKPSDMIIARYFFEEDATNMMKRQNKTPTFGKFGFPSFFNLDTNYIPALTPRSRGYRKARRSARGKK
jgi:hypothetical protein